MLPLIAATPPLEQIDYLRRLGQLTQYATKDLQSSLGKLSKKETDFFQTYRPEAKVLNRLKRAEKAILYNMFLSGEAIDLFQRDVKFFHDDIYRQIATYLIEIYQSDPPDHQALINHISMSDAKDQQVIINTIAELMSEKNLPKADNHQLHDYLNTLKEERDKLVKAHQIKSSIAGKPDTEQARIIKELHKQVKPEQKGENDNETIGLLLCKGKNEVVAEYSLKGISNALGISDYQISKIIPETLQSELPQIQDIEDEFKELD
jgi:hypothetical protein